MNIDQLMKFVFPLLKGFGVMLTEQQQVALTAFIPTLPKEVENVVTRIRDFGARLDSIDHRLERLEEHLATPTDTIKHGR